MTVIQTNIFICDGCGNLKGITNEQSVWDDPVIEYPEDWNFKDGDDLCPICISTKRKHNEKLFKCVRHGFFSDIKPACKECVDVLMLL